MSKIEVVILRKKEEEDKQYWERFEYDGDLNIPITTLLERINQQEHIRNDKGEEVEPICYACSCQQGLCGSCAFVVNGKPGLGCQIFCNESLNEKKELIIEPLSKFPVIRDLEVDKSVLYEAMKDMKLWLNSEAKVDCDRTPLEYELSLCLMCGCCLEACPNYQAGDLFAGVPAAVAAAKYVGQECDSEHTKFMKKKYQKRFNSGCVKSFACGQVCPMKIPVQTTISKMNRMTVWNIWNMISSKE